MAFSNKVIDGGDILLYVNGDLLGCATSHSIEISNAVREVSCKGSGDWTSAEYGRHSWTASVDALFSLYEGDGNARYKAMFQLMIQKQTITVKSEYSEGADIFALQGEAIITGVSKNAGDADNASYSVSLQGRGMLGIVGEDLFYLQVTATGATHIVVNELNQVHAYSGAGALNIAVPDGATYSVTAYNATQIGRATNIVVSGANEVVAITLA